MKSVGATNSFVRLPCVVEGMILGIISGVISLGLVWAFYEFAINPVSYTHLDVYKRQKQSGS